MIREINITDEMVAKAKAKADDMGKLNNSIMSGDGNIAGFLGEEVVLQVLGGVEQNTYDYDMISSEGYKVDVKTKRTAVKPREYYECSVAAFNTKQKCDYYAFVRVDNSLKKAWFLGVYPKNKYYEDAKFLKKGEVDPSNNFTVRADCYNMPISSLQEGLA